MADLTLDLLQSRGNIMNGHAIYVEAGLMVAHIEKDLIFVLAQKVRIDSPLGLSTKLSAGTTTKSTLSSEAAPSATPDER